MATITQTEFDHAKLRGSQEDYKRVLAALEADGSLTIVDDPEVEVETDEEGNEIPAEPTPVGGAVQIEVENEPTEEEEDEEE